MCLKSIFDGKGKQHKLDSEKIGDLDKLQTNAKGNLVEAVNEVAGKTPKKTEDWVFTLEDDSTVTKKVAVME